VSHRAFKLPRTAYAEVFGLGPELGETKRACDEVHFQFMLEETKPSIWYLVFEPRGIERKDEVDITLNGVHVGFANPSAGKFPKEQRLKLPRKYLKPGIPNEIVFDNVDNPPGAKHWAIARPRLVVKELPDESKDELLRVAKELYEGSELALHAREPAPENNALAWTRLHKALLLLEMIEPKPDLYDRAQTRLREFDLRLDDVCSKFFLEAKKFEELGNPGRAQLTYKGGLEFFPAGEDEHWCRARLLEKIVK
jgi:hypothetical protein